MDVNGFFQILIINVCKDFVCDCKKSAVKTAFCDSLNYYVWLQCVVV